MGVWSTRDGVRLIGWLDRLATVLVCECVPGGLAWMDTGTVVCVRKACCDGVVLGISIQIAGG